MKILVGNNKLRNPGGSETYTYALVNELVKRGHVVECVASGKEGMVSEKMKMLGVPVHFGTVRDKFYDLALLSHTTSIALAQDVSAFKVQTCHGIYHTLEQPVPLMDAYVAISEEVVLHLRMKGYNSTIIRNGVDCNRYVPNDENEKLNTVLSLAHGEEANNIIEEACNELDLDLLLQNKYGVPIWDIENYIRQADLVISLGRGVYEAAASAKNIIVFDSRAYAKQGAIGDGFVTDENFGKFLTHNCSGRYSKRQFKAENLQLELQQYSPEMGRKLRAFAIENLNIEKQVDKYLELVR